MWKWRGESGLRGGLCFSFSAPLLIVLPSLKRWCCSSLVGASILASFLIHGTIINAPVFPIQRIHHRIVFICESDLKKVLVGLDRIIIFRIRKQCDSPPTLLYTPPCPTCMCSNMIRWGATWQMEDLSHSPFLKWLQVPLSEPTFLFSDMTAKIHPGKESGVCWASCCEGENGWICRFPAVVLVAEAVLDSHGKADSTEWAANLWLGCYTSS